MYKATTWLWATFLIYFAAKYGYAEIMKQPSLKYLVLTIIMIGLLQAREATMNYFIYKDNPSGAAKQVYIYHPFGYLVLTLGSRISYEESKVRWRQLNELAVMLIIGLIGFHVAMVKLF